MYRYTGTVRYPHRTKTFGPMHWSSVNLCTQLRRFARGVYLCFSINSPCKITTNFNNRKAMPFLAAEAILVWGEWARLLENV